SYCGSLGDSDALAHSTSCLTAAAGCTVGAVAQAVQDVAVLQWMVCALELHEGDVKPLRIPCIEAAVDLAAVAEDVKPSTKPVPPMTVAAKPRDRSWRYCNAHGFKTCVWRPVKTMGS